ncbi:hypothetical protein [Micromonospora sp. L32]
MSVPVPDRPGRSRPGDRAGRRPVAEARPLGSLTTVTRVVIATYEPV